MTAEGSFEDQLHPEDPTPYIEASREVHAAVDNFSITKVRREDIQRLRALLQDMLQNTVGSYTAEQTHQFYTNVLHRIMTEDLKEEAGNEYKISLLEQFLRERETGVLEDEPEAEVAEAAQ